MHGLQIVVFFLLALVSADLASETEGGNPVRSYFLDGVDSHDGMGAFIDYDRKLMGVASDAFDLLPCTEPEGSFCFVSDYMVFSTPPQPELTEWVRSGTKFEIVGRCDKLLSGMAQSVSIIRSKQRAGFFEFYYNDEVGLLGWRLTYIRHDGRIDADEYRITAKR